MKKFLVMVAALGLVLGLAVNSYAELDKSSTRSKLDKSNTKLGGSEPGYPLTWRLEKDGVTGTWRINDESGRSLANVDMQNAMYNNGAFRIAVDSKVNGKVKLMLTHSGGTRV